MAFNQVHPLFADYVRYETRRQFFRRGGNAVGAAALAALAGGELLAEDRSAKADDKQQVATGGVPGLPHFPAKAKNVSTLRSLLAII